MADKSLICGGRTDIDRLSAAVVNKLTSRGEVTIAESYIMYHGASGNIGEAPLIFSILI